MKDAHLTPELLERLLQEDNGAEQNRFMLHHLAVCPGCYAVGGYLLDLYRAGAIGLEFCVIDIDFARSRAAAPALFATLQAFSAEEQRHLVATDPGYKCWGLCELLCRESEHAAADDASRALSLARLAVLVATRLDEWQPAERAWLCQLRGYAYAHLGNAWRVKGNLRKAERAFARADRWWQSGEAEVGNVLDYEARILAMKASLRTAQRRLPEALDLLEEASVANRDHLLAGALYVCKAKVLEELGQIEAAISLLEAAAPFVDQERDPRLYLCLRHNLLWLLATAGRYEEARGLLPEVEALGQGLGNDLDLLRLVWAKGRIAAGLGEAETAIAHFSAVRDEFATRQISYDAALASLELATVYAQAGLSSEVKAIAREIVPMLEGQEVHREALAALAVFVHAAEAENATAALVRRITSFLGEARHNPGLQFREGD